MADDRLHFFGIRHHGPGSARSLLTALAAARPDVVLIEGPPDAQDAVAAAGHADLKPPVALLVYADESPAEAVFYPFAEYSPEWVSDPLGARQPGAGALHRSAAGPPAHGRAPACRGRGGTGGVRRGRHGARTGGRSRTTPSIR